jgi:hypothetical protein
MAIKAYYRFNGNANDLSGNSNNPSSSSVSYVANEAVFNGSSNYIQYASKFIPQGAFTVSFVVVKKRDALEYFITDINDSSIQYGHSFYFHLGNLNYVHAKATSAANFALSIPSVSNNIKHHVVVSWDGTSGVNKAMMMFDGKAQFTTAIQADLGAPAVNVKFGCLAGYSLYFSMINLNDLIVSNNAWTPAIGKNEYARIKGFF